MQSWGRRARGWGCKAWGFAAVGFKLKFLCGTATPSQSAAVQGLPASVDLIQLEASVPEPTSGLRVLKKHPKS